MKFAKWVIIMIAVLLGNLWVMAQPTSTVSGKVTDPSNEPIIGVAIQIKGTTAGTVTDLNSNFRLENVSTNAVLIFSNVGMTTKEIKVGGQRSINVVMEEDNVLLEETVVIGYGSIKKADLTGAVSVVKSDDFKKDRATKGVAVRFV